MKRILFLFIICCTLLATLSTKVVAQAGNAINFQNATYNSHGDFIYCGQPNYGFTNKLTVSAWVKWTTDPSSWAVGNHNQTGDEREGSYSTYIAYATHNTLNTTTEHGQFWLRNAKTGNKVEFTVENTSGTKATASFASNLVSGIWYFLTGVYDGSLSSNQLTLYINGTVVANATLTGDIRANTDCRLNMGRLPWGYGFFVGYMDEVRVWNTALTAGEILTQKTSPTTVQDSYCKSWWNFNEGNGTTITDSKGTASGKFYSALTDVHGPNVNFANKIIEDADRAFVTNAWNGKTIYTVAGAGVDESNSVVSNTGNVFTLTNGFGGTSPDNLTTPILDGLANMTWFGILDGSETSQWVTSDAPLPVEMTTFNGYFKNKNIFLTWQTATEVNNFGFNVERASTTLGTNLSFPGGERKWKTIGFVEGAGNSNSPKVYSFNDKLMANGKYVYRLKQIDNDGQFSYSKEIEVEVKILPVEFALYQNYPNPFNPITSIKYSIPSGDKNEMLNVSLKILNVIGNEVAVLLNEKKEAGNYEVKFDASQLSSGVYFYKLEAGNFSTTKKLILMK